MSFEDERDVQVNRGQPHAWASSIYNLGPVTVGFFVMLFVNVGWLPSPMLKSLENLEKVYTESQNNANESVKEGQRLVADTQKILANVQQALAQQSVARDATQAALAKGIRQICRNTAKTLMANEKCDEL